MQSSQLRLDKIGAIEKISGNHATWEVDALERYKLNNILFLEFQVYVQRKTRRQLAD
jgi:hypothetical protein